MKKLLLILLLLPSLCFSQQKWIKILNGQSIGIVGSSGSGKTTLIDVLLCLLKPKFNCMKKFIPVCFFLLIFSSSMVIGQKKGYEIKFKINA